MKKENFIQVIQTRPLKWELAYQDFLKVHNNNLKFDKFDDKMDVVASCDDQNKIIKVLVTD